MANRKRVIIWAWVAALVAAGVFPPWAHRGCQMGIIWLFAPPTYWSIQVDISRLLIGWVIATAIAGACTSRKNTVGDVPPASVFLFGPSGPMWLHETSLPPLGRRSLFPIRDREGYLVKQGPV